VTTPEHELDEHQRAVVDHGPTPLRVVGAFGSGLTTALNARAARLRRAGRRPLVLRPTPVAFAASVLARAGRAVRVVSSEEQRDLVSGLLSTEGAGEWPTLHGELRDPAFAREVAEAVRLYSASFLGEEELFVHADAAGQLERWADLARFARRYRAALDAQRVLDQASVVVAASTLLRQPEHLADERALFDDLIIDDYQLSDFATTRLVAQLAGPRGSVTVAGNAGAWIGEDDGRDAKHLASFTRRYDARDIELSNVHRVAQRPPALRLVDAPEEADDLVGAMANDHDRVHVLRRADVDEAVGREWELVIIPDADDTHWPSPRPARRWFDPALLSGPDMPTAAERDRRRVDEDRRRFGVATSRATVQTLLVSVPPVTRFVGDLVT
jgi:superfamily I DNA/RNA helicase